MKRFVLIIGLLGCFQGVAWAGKGEESFDRFFDGLAKPESLYGDIVKVKMGGRI